MDLFVVPTIGFDLLYALVIVRLDRRDMVWINVTQNPTAEWIARQITEAFPWNDTPRYLIRDRDRIYGDVALRRLRAMGIRDKPIAPTSPWQNGFAELGSIRRECVDHIAVWGEGALAPDLAGLCPLLQRHQNASVTGQNAPAFRSVQRIGNSRHTRSSADSITTTSGFKFSVHTGH